MAIELLTPFTKVELEPEIKEKKRKQVGILGGNFNPVHNAHLIVADQVRQQLGLDQVLLMPEYQPPHVDKKETIHEYHRLKMLELAIEGIEGLAIETIELERKGISYTLVCPSPSKVSNYFGIALTFGDNLRFSFLADSL